MLSGIRFDLPVVMFSTSSRDIQRTDLDENIAVERDHCSLILFLVTSTVDCASSTIAKLISWNTQGRRFAYLVAAFPPHRNV